MYAKVGDVAGKCVFVRGYYFEFALLRSENPFDFLEPAKRDLGKSQRQIS